MLSMAPVLLAEDDEVHACIVEASLANARLANPVIRARTGDEAAAYLATVNGGVNPSRRWCFWTWNCPASPGSGCSRPSEAWAAMPVDAR